MQISKSSMLLIRRVRFTSQDIGHKVIKKEILVRIQLFLIIQIAIYYVYYTLLHNLRLVKYNPFSKFLGIVSRLQHASVHENIWLFFLLKF